MNEYTNMAFSSLIQSSKKLLNALPDYASIADFHGKILLANDKAAQIMGFKSMKVFEPIFYDEMRCPAAEFSEAFLAQDNFTLQYGSTSFLSGNRYAHSWNLVLGKKQLIKNSAQENEGVLCHCLDITDYGIIDIARFLLESDKKYLVSKTKQFTYSLQSKTSYPFQISERQMECLFYLLRGYSIKSIATKLSLSCRTIEEYLNIIKTKLECLNKSQLIEKSIQHGLINIIPKSLFKLEIE